MPEQKTTPLSDPELNFADFRDDLMDSLEKIFATLSFSDMCKVTMSRWKVEVKGYFNYPHLIRLDLKRLDQKPFFGEDD